MFLCINGAEQIQSSVRTRSDEFDLKNALFVFLFNQSASNLDLVACIILIYTFKGTKKIHLAETEIICHKES